MKLFWIGLLVVGVPVGWFLYAGESRSAAFVDATEAIMRFREFRTQDTHVEARREFDKANRSLALDDQLLLSNFYSAAEIEAVSGESRDRERAEACQKEALGVTFFSYLKERVQGDCQKLWDKETARIQDEFHREMVSQKTADIAPK